MAQQNPTVFQKLTKMFGFPGQSKPEQAPSFNFDKNELLKTDSIDTNKMTVQIKTTFYEEKEDTLRYKLSQFYHKQ